MKITVIEVQDSYLLVVIVIGERVNEEIDYDTVVNENNNTKVMDETVVKEDIRDRIWDNLESGVVKDKVILQDFALLRKEGHVVCVVNISEKEILNDVKDGSNSKVGLAISKDGIFVVLKDWTVSDYKIHGIVFQI